MSKRKRFDFDPTGKSWEEIIEADPTHMKGISQKSFAKAVSRLVSAYNKRAKRLEQSGLAMQSPAYRGIAGAGKTRLSVKGKSFQELMSTYAYAKRFLTERTTSSVKGTRALKKATEERLGYEFKSREESYRFWEAVDKLREMNIGNDQRTSTDIQREVADLMFNEGMSIDDVLDHYGIAIEADTPDFYVETGEIFGFGEDDEDEEEESEFFDDETPW